MPLKNYVALTVRESVTASCNYYPAGLNRLNGSNETIRHFFPVLRNLQLTVFSRLS